MARLAAYYQEDFHYPVIRGPKQRKSAYVFYEEPNYDTFYNSSLNNNHHRNLALSEPSLSPLSHTYKPHKMTLKNKSIVYGNQLIENAFPSMQYVDNDHNVCYSDDRFITLQENMHDNESIFRDDISLYEHQLSPRNQRVSKDKVNKRFSYAEPRNHNYYPEVYPPKNYDKYYHRRQIEAPYDGYENRYQQIPNGYFCEPPQTCVSPRSNHHYRDTSNHRNWPQWSLSPDDMQVDRRLLSPPSPLDSGLSSQSIASSPSLDADCFLSHVESYGVGKYEKNVSCSCQSIPYTDIKRHEPNLSRHDSGRSSGVYSAYGYPKESRQSKNGVKHLIQAKDNSELNGYQNNQIRYGKLGLLGEPTNRDSTLNKTTKKKLERTLRHENGQIENMHNSYGSENGFVSQRRPSSRSSVSRNQHTKFDRPCVVITEASEKSTESDGAMTPDRDKSDKSEEFESSSGASVSESTSKSSSVVSDDKNGNRKSNRSTEKEIRELEDMYEKCNLSDADLLDRAERRDLPTVHQMKLDSTTKRLKRSKSDTIYETLSSVFQNPYKITQRAPPLRRSGLPDRIADDMALRKLKKSTSKSSSNGTKNTASYMLCNSHFTPTVSSGKDILFLDYPDVEYDDLSYRSHYLGKKSKVPDPQPPFGIPLRPPPPQKVFSDYLHAIPSNSPQPLCHPRGNPDVVRDDLAFRALRKEEPERLYYDMSQLYRSKRS